ncbi:proton channel OtopLc-like [Saccostrea echinata]|uniref:proton channel OtopLc-like n=1 Tax=Saccostrea echinata TaxID=191078 RepID=UPI002A83182B|nr:proton channel OtopLc-like [Saccostrea echinata]
MNGYTAVTNFKDTTKTINIDKQEPKIGIHKNDCNLDIPESDSGDDSENTYRPYSDTVDTDASNTQDEGDPPSPPVSRVADRCLLNNLNIVSSIISSDSDSCTEGEFILDRGGQTTDETSTSSESDETQIWVGNRTRTSGSVSTPPLPSLTSSNASDSCVQSPSNRNNTIPRYSSREVSSSGNASVVTSQAGTGDEANVGRSHSWHELPSDVECQIQRRSSRNISLLRHNPRTGNTETIVIETHPNGDSGLGHDVHSNSEELFYPDSPSNASWSILKKNNGRYNDVNIPVDSTLMDNMFTSISGLYAMAVVVLGCVIPISKIFSKETFIFSFLFDGFYIYIYTISVFFLIYAYVYLLQDKSLKLRKNLRRGQYTTTSGSRGNLKRKYSFDDSRTYHTGSFYLRLGAVGFGIGSMIQSGLHFGELFDTHPDPPSYPCENIAEGARPILHLIFTFVQLYFVFLNSKMCIHRYKTVARFGLMHMVATNVCVWVQNIVQETLREIRPLYETGAGTNETRDSVVQNHTGYRLGCNRNSLMSDVVETSSSYLYPCTIEYSLICAGILYVMWRNIGKGGRTHEEVTSEEESKAKSHRMTVDCSRSSRGLFLGIFILVGTVITMITFFVLIRSNSYLNTAVKLEHLSAVVIYVVTSIAVVLAFHRMQTLRVNSERELDLEESLLLLGLGGLYVFTFFSIIAASMKKGPTDYLVILSCVFRLFQASLQTVFLLSGMRKSSWRREQERQKPGREYVTFLLVSNIAMWGLNTFEIQRSRANPVQLEFYGFVAWTIFNHLSVPLTIFFRFHSTVCLSNIWKSAWKRRMPAV